jgi:endonuclease YncB( thermonuclease family)
LPIRANALAARTNYHSTAIAICFQLLRYTLRPAALFAVLLLFNLSAAPREIEARVIALSDGDTMTVLLDTIQTRVRLWGMDCSEARQPFGSRAKQFTSSLAFGKTVALIVLSTDRYRRPVAAVTLPDGSNLNQKIVRARFGWRLRR